MIPTSSQDPTWVWVLAELKPTSIRKMDYYTHTPKFDAWNKVAKPRKSVQARLGVLENSINRNIMSPKGGIFEVR